MDVCRIEFPRRQINTNLKATFSMYRRHEWILTYQLGFCKSDRSRQISRVARTGRCCTAYSPGTIEMGKRKPIEPAILNAISLESTSW